MDTPSLELTLGDFNAYLPERASSNVYSRPRLEFKHRAMRWARGMVQRLAEIGVQVTALGSDEHPSVRNGFRVDSQRVYFLRPDEQRNDLELLLNQRTGIAGTLRDASSYQRYACLVFCLDSEKIEISAQLHPDAWVDAETFHARWSNRLRRLQFIESITALPQEFVFGVGKKQRLSVAKANEQNIQNMLTLMHSKQAALMIGWVVPRELALQHAQTFHEQLEGGLVALAPIYQQLVWTPEDDPAQLAATFEKMQNDLLHRAQLHAQQQREHDEQQAIVRQEQTNICRERTKQRVQYDSARGRIHLSNLFKPFGKNARNLSKQPHEPSSFEHPAFASLSPSDNAHTEAADPGVAGTPPAAMYANGSSDNISVQNRGNSCDSKCSGGGKMNSVSHGFGSSKGASQKLGSQVGKPKRPVSAEPICVSGAVVEPGAKVRVLSGPFRGKVGVLTESDGRGSVRVMLGLLSTRVLVDELEAVVEPKNRPVLHSSHRRDGLLGRSGK